MNCPQWTQSITGAEMTSARYHQSKSYEYSDRMQKHEGHYRIWRFAIDELVKAPYSNSPR